MNLTEGIFTEALEGHDGNIFYYLSRFPQLFGEGIFLLLFPGLYLWYRSKEKITILSASLLLGTLFVFLFLSIIVKSKVVSHLYFIAPFAMMLMAYAIVFIIRKWLKKGYLIAIFLMGVFVLNAKPEKIISDQSPENEERNTNISNARAYAAQQFRLPKGAVVINVPDCISFMFFNKGMVAYELFSEEQLKTLEAKHIPIFAFAYVRNRPLPEYILHYPYLTLLNDTIK